jgi:hypothetical protein
MLRVRLLDHLFVPLYFGSVAMRGTAKEPDAALLSPATPPEVQRATFPIATLLALTSFHPMAAGLAAAAGARCLCGLGAGLAHV